MKNTSPPVEPEEAVEQAAPAPRRRPPITEAEDQPFEDSAASAAPSKGDSPRLKTISEKEQEHKHRVEDYKNRVGGLLLIACFVMIVGFAIGDALFQIDSALFSGAFEFAKTIATAVIGYLFAANTKREP